LIIQVPTWCVLCVEIQFFLSRPESNTCGDNSGIHENPRFPPLSKKKTAKVVIFIRGEYVQNIAHKKTSLSTVETSYT
jgi:hypothetical protein